MTAIPELRAYLDAWVARFAARGMCNPADQTPAITGEPTEQVAERDLRSRAQRQHDALCALVRASPGGGSDAWGQGRCAVMVALVDNSARVYA